MKDKQTTKPLCERLQLEIDTVTTIREMLKMRAAADQKYADELKKIRTKFEPMRKPDDDDTMSCGAVKVLNALIDFNEGFQTLMQEQAGEAQDTVGQLISAALLPAKKNTLVRFKTQRKRIDDMLNKGKLGPDLFSSPQACVSAPICVLSRRAAVTKSPSR